MPQPAASTPAAPKPEALALEVSLGMREEAAFLQQHLGLRVLETTGLGSQAVMRLPETIATRDAAQAYLENKLPGLGSVVSNGPPLRATVETFELRHAVKTLQWPLGRRAHGDLTDETRMETENEFRRMLGVPLRSPLAESQDLLHKEYKDAMAALKLQREIGFAQYLQDGRYVLPVIERDSAVEKVVLAAIADGQLASASAQFSHTPEGDAQLTLEPAALRQAVGWVAHGFKAKDGTEKVAAAESPEMRQARNDFARSQRVELMLKAMNARLLSDLPPERRAAIEPQLNAPETKRDTVTRRAHTESQNATLQAETLLLEASRPQTAMYEVASLQRALAKAQRLVDEPRFWSGMEKSQQFSHHNQLREVLKEDIGDMQQLVARPGWSQKGLAWLVNDSGYSDSLRTLGHLMMILDRTEKPGAKPAIGQQIGAAEFAEAFHFSSMVMRPQAAEAKEAAYFLREQTGQVGFGEKVKRNAFMGIKPIIHSIEPAKEHPLMAGAAVLGLAVYSAYVPKRFSPYYQLNKLMHDMMERLQGQDVHEAGEAVSETLKKQLKQAEEELNRVKNDKGKGYKAAFNAGHKSGFLSMIGVFVAYNAVEDIIVHVPLALVSVTVGYMGAGVGKKVLGPMFNDLGDIAGKFLPDVTDGVKMDAKTVKHLAQSSPIKVIGPLKQAYYDMDEMGALSTLRHLADQGTRALGSALHGLSGPSQQPSSGRASA